MDYEKDDKELKELAESIIAESDALAILRDYLHEVRIGYQWSEKKKFKDGGVVYADCEKVKAKLKEFIEYDFIITFYDSARELSENAKRVLMYHELRHVGIKEASNGDITFYIVPHTLQDFKEIVEKYGMDWELTIK